MLNKSLKLQKKKRRNVKMNLFTFLIFCINRSLTTFLTTQLKGPSPRSRTLTVSSVPRLKSENQELQSNLFPIFDFAYQLALDESLFYRSGVFSWKAIFGTVRRLSFLWKINILKR